jgi:hypothetical protein
MTALAVGRQWRDGREMIRAREDVKQACCQAGKDGKHSVRLIIVEWT